MRKQCYPTVCNFIGNNNDDDVMYSIDIVCVQDCNVKLTNVQKDNEDQQ